MSQSSTWKLMELMNEGGWVMWGLFAFSIVALATAIERAFVLRRARRHDAAFLERLRALTTTAGGLVVAVPTQLAYSALAGRLERITGDIESTGNLLLEVREELSA